MLWVWYTNTSTSKKENDVSIDLNKKINDQLIESRKSRHQEYISSNYINNDDINKDTQIDNYDIDKKSNSHDVVDSTAPKTKTKAYPRGTCLVTRGSMLSYIDETRISRKFNVRVRSFPGTKTDNMFYYLVPLLEGGPDHVILHVGTGDGVG